MNIISFPRSTALHIWLDVGPKQITILNSVQQWVLNIICEIAACRV